MKNLKIKAILKRLFLVIIILLLIAVFIHLFINPYRGSVSWKQQNISLNQPFTKEAALEDLNYLYKKYTSVDYTFKNGVPDTFKQQYNIELQNLSANPTMLEVWQASSRIVHTLDIGHDGVYTWVKEDFWYNVSYSLENGTVFIFIDGNSYEVENINGVFIGDILENASQMLSYENMYDMEHRILSNLQSFSGITLLTGVYTQDYTVTYLEEGVSKTIAVEPYPENTEKTEQSDFINYTIDKDNNLAILTLDQCNYNKHYKKVLKEFFTQVKENSITNIAVDLRKNGGGSSLVANEFVKYLNVNKVEDYTSYFRFKIISAKSPFHTMKGNKKKGLIYDGAVYVLTSASTYSSGMNFSVVLQDNELAKIIGEPCGNRPSQYGETVTFQLPNSKLYFVCSTCYFERPNKSIADASYQVPDYQTDADLADEKLYEVIR